MGSSRIDLVAFVAAAVPLVIVAVAGRMAWVDAWDRGVGELARTADSAAEYAERVLASQILSARMVDRMLAHISDDQIRERELELHEQLADLLPAIPMASSVTLSDAAGTMLLMATVYPVPAISVADREWVRALSAPQPPPVHIGGLAEGRVVGNLSFSVSVPRTPSGAFEEDRRYHGTINVSVDPAQMAAGLARITQEPEDIIALVRADGEILALTSGIDGPVPRVPETSPLLMAAATGEGRGAYTGMTLGLRPGLAIGRELQIAFRAVGDLPVYVTVSRPNAAILRPWLNSMAGLLALGLPASAALGYFAASVRRRERALGTSEAEFRAAFAGTGAGQALFDSRTRRIERVNRRLCEIAGRPESELVGRSIDDLVGQPHPALEAHDQAVDAPAPFRPLNRPEGDVRWVDVTIAPIEHPTVPDPRAIATVVDMTERRHEEERQRLLMREIDHRAKNALAVVQAVIRLTPTDRPAEFARKVIGRIDALARAHELLSRERWEGASVARLVREELAAYRGGGRVEFDGPDLGLEARAVQPLAIAIHELATNAAKHGALMRDGGALRVSWNVPADRQHLEVVWSERWPEDGSVPSASRGTGLRVIEGAIAQLGGSLRFDRSATGLTCSMTIPSSQLKETTPPPRLEATVAARTTPPLGLRVLVVEDEPLIKLDMEAMLGDLGCVIAASVTSESAALDAAEALIAGSGVDVALLDVQLGSRPSFAIAARLARNGIPFVFASGHSSIDYQGPGRWASVRKPVQAADLAGALARVVSRRGG